MEIDVASVIEEVLLSRKEVNIKGLGSLKYVDIPAKLAEDKSEIFPPRSVLQFHTADSSNKALRKALRKKYDLNKDQAQKAIKKFNQSLVNTILNYNEVIIQDVTHIKSNNGDIKLTPIGIFTESSKLPTVSVRPLDQVKQTAAMPSVAAAAAAAAGGFVALASSEADKKSSGQTPVTTVPPAPTPQPVKPVLPTTPSVTPSDKPSATLSVKPSSRPSATSKAPPTSSAAATGSEPKAKPIAPATTPATTPSATIPPARPSAEKTLQAKKPAILSSQGKEQSLQSKIEKSVISSTNPKPMSLNDKFSTTTGAKDAGKPAPSAIKTSPKYAVTDSFKESIKTGSTTNTATPKPAPPYVAPPQQKESCLGPIMAMLALLLLVALCYKGCNYAMNKYGGKKNAATELSSSTDANGGENGSSDKSGNEADNESEGGDADESSSASDDRPETCVIITGSFSKYENVNKMERQLEKGGYKVYQEEYGPYTRIGLEFDCRDENLEDYIQQIRRSVPNARKAWYLQPELHVDY